jgi:hypothetical protein
MAARFELPGGEASLAAEFCQNAARQNLAKAGAGVGQLFGESQNHSPILSFSLALRYKGLVSVTPVSGYGNELRTHSPQSGLLRRP